MTAKTVRHAVKSKKVKTTVRKKTARDRVAGKKPILSTGVVDEISVRMYCHGFGDCFLLTFKCENKPVYQMLIDCGMLTGSQSILGECIENIKQDCGNHINLVVQTHEHKDHISGFNIKDKQKKLIWDDITVDDVWLAWTENTDPGGDDLAISLKGKFKKKKQALAKALGLYKNYINSSSHVSLMKTDHESPSSLYHSAQLRYAEAMQQMLNFYDIDEKEVGMAASGGDELGLTMKDAMRYFIESKGKGKGKRAISYWNPGDFADAKTTGLNGIKFYFLGPPKDYDLLRKMDDKEHIEMYLSDLGVSDNYYLALTEGGESFSPFHEKYKWEKGKLLYPEDNPDDPDFVWNLYNSDENKWRDITADWLQNAGSLALNLDSYTNNTSLVIAIEFEKSGKVLLFAADAQIGNWISWTQPAKEGDKEPAIKWESPGASGSKSITVADLLRRTVFYKVGHHSSHNATARKHGLELMTSDELVAMIPVDEKVAKNQGKKGWEMPAKDLYKRLQEATKCRIIRLDNGNIIKGNVNIIKDDPNSIPRTAVPTEIERQAFNRNVTEAKTLITTDDGTNRPMYLEYKLKG
jgi:hypothetical protein